MDLKTGLVLIMLVVADSAGSLLLSQGMKKIGKISTLKPQELWQIAGTVITSHLLQMGVFCMAIAFFMLVALLSWADLSFVLPATALTEPLNMLGTKFILKEKVTKFRWISIVLICLGIFLISLQPK